MADVPEILQQVLADRYAVQRELGRGANAAVYLARDLRHDRLVAVKVLQAELALTVRTERFFREIGLTAKLSHPHILTLIDSGQAGEALFYVMPFVDGESLRHRIQRQRQLPLEEALGIARDVASALAYAHARGVVHRDIKPENILLHSGHAVVMDFGIARALTVSHSEAVTESGVATGTPGYMSPEQGSGGEVDGRSDIYSLGCVVYEMLAGRPPFTGVTAQEILARHQIDPVPSLRAARNAVPSAIERVVNKALAKQPADRYSDAGAFAQALVTPVEKPSALPWTRSLIGVGAAATLVLAAGWSLRERVGNGPSVEPASLAVLPCENLTTDSANAYFSEGMAGELITRLSRVPGLHVAAKTSSLAAVRKGLSIRQLADTLLVANVLECSIRRAHGQFRASVRLLRGRDETQLWTETYDRPLTGVDDVIGVQEEIARAVVGVLPARLLTPATPQPNKYSKDTAAFDRYLRATQLISRGAKEENARAIQLLQEAIRADSTFALAYSALAIVYRNAANLNYLPRAQAYRSARVAALKAVELDDGLAEAHASLGFVYFSADWNWEASQLEFRKALERDPNLASAHAGYALLLAVVGQSDSAVAHAVTARQLDRLTGTTAIGSALMLARHYPEAISELRRVADISPRVGNAILARALLAAGRAKDAVAVLQAMRDAGVAPDPGVSALAYARSGFPDSARVAIAGLKGGNGAARPSAALAWAYLGLGERTQAAAAAAAAVEAQEVNPMFVSDPLWDPIRSEPGFTAMRKSVGLAR